MLTQQRIKEIENMTKDVLQTAYGDVNSLTPIIDLNKIVEQYGLQLREGTFDDPSVAGAYDKKEKVIYIPADDSYQRRAFTVAHELGHYFLHKSKNKEIFLREQAIKLNNNTEDKQEETEANWFAASLLMPENLIKNLWLATKDTDQLSFIFGVSNTAVYWRLRNLGLIE